MLDYVTHTSSKRMPLRTTRLGCQRWQTAVLEKRNEIVFSMCSVQCGSMEAKALSFVLRTPHCEHHHLSTRRAFMYVVGGLVGINDTCYFLFDM